MKPALLALALWLPGAALAEILLEEVVVTARRRAEDAQQLALALSNFSAEQVAQLKLQDLSRLSKLSPSLSLTQYNSATQLYLRGVGSNTSGASDDASVALFVDDVYWARPGFFDTDLFGIESIEVLRGPQGTLYGKNVAGGAIRIQTRAPAAQPQLNLKLAAGDYQQRQLGLYASALLAGHWSANLAASVQRRAGYVENFSTAEPERDQRADSVRASLLWQPAALSVRLVADISEQQLAGAGRSQTGAGFLGTPALPHADQRYASDSPHRGFTDSKQGGVSLLVDYPMADAMTLSAITAVREGELRFSENLLTLYGVDQAIYAGLINAADEQSRQWSQELRLAAAGGAWDWVTGLFLLHEQTQRTESYDPRALGVALGAGYIDTEISAFDSENTTRSFGIFAETDYSVSEQWVLTAGLRYSEEQKQFDSRATGSNFLGLDFLVQPYRVENLSQNWPDWSGKLALSYIPDESSYTYLSFTQGFKSGAYNSVAANVRDASEPVNPEQVNQLEWGLKWRSTDQRLQANLAAYYLDYRDLQIYQVDSQGQTQVENAARARIRGLDLDLDLAPGGHWLVWARLALMRAEYTDYVSATGADLTGNQLLRAPDQRASLGVSWRTDRVSASLDYSYQSKLYMQADNNPLSAIEAYGLLNARVSWHWPASGWSLQLWADNLLNAGSEVFRLPIAGTVTRIAGQPRMLGLSVEWRFGQPPLP